jgi:hypothetical protein
MATPPRSTSPAKLPNLSADDIVVIVFAFIGLGGGILLALYTNAPPIITSFLFSTGITALIYRFLGGIQGTSYAVGALKLGGTAACLVGIALLINPYLEAELKFRLIKDDVLAGTWHWVYAKGGWDGQLVFVKGKDGDWTFSGQETEWSDGNGKPRFEVKNGTAKVIGENSLQLKFDAEDHTYNRTIHLESAAPLKLLPAFRGELREDNKTDPWGMMIYKWPPPND